MKFSEPIKLSDLADQYDLKIIGDHDLMIHGINEIHRVSEGDITFVDAEKYYAAAVKSAASFIIIDKIPEITHDKTLLLCNEPFKIYDSIVSTHRPIHEMIDASSFKSDPTTIIEDHVTIGKNVKLGKHCHIQSHVYIGDHCIIGDHVTIQANSSIGTDAFYYKKEQNTYTKWTSGGRVIIQDHVDIGPGCTVNRGVSSDTLIGHGTKIDSQVQIGHGVIVGENCLIAAQVGIAGKSIIEDEVVLYGQVGVAQNITIGKGAVILAKSGVSKNLKGDEVYFGYPAVVAKTKYKELATLRRLSNS